MTKNGKKILELINASAEHFTAEQIYKELQNTSSKMAMATVYNNLNSLYEQGMIRKITMEGESARYDKRLRHDHLVCRNCGKIWDLNLGDMTGSIEEKSGVKIDSYDLKIFYLCNECKKREEMRSK